jgi:peptidoglycan/xylan/chitin deacetylase (PgdA/CDA1 family)
MLKRLLRRAFIDLMSAGATQAVLNGRMKNDAVIFMMHRFSSGRYQSEGHDPVFVEESIRYLKHLGRNIVSLDELFRSIRGELAPIENAVVFTIDDGFRDQAEIGAPIFIGQKVPVTIFLINDFVSQVYWLAESRLAYVIDRTSKNSVTFDHDGHAFTLDLGDGEDRSKAKTELIYHCKRLPLENVEDLVECLSKRLDVEVPRKAPIEYRAMTWDMVRELESQGVEFGAHTLTHPALSCEHDARSRSEIFSSYSGLTQQVSHPSSVFCYPTGRTDIDYGDREVEIVREAGFSGALSTCVGYAAQPTLQDEWYGVPRFAFPDTHDDLKQVVLHMEHFKRQFRSII